MSKTAIIVVLGCMLVAIAALIQVRSRGSQSVSTSKRASDYFDDTDAIALCDAIAIGNQERVLQLCTTGAPRVVGKHGMTPVLWAILHRCPDCLRAVLEAGADPAIIVDSDFKARDEGVRKGLSAVHIAASMNDSAYLQALLEGGVDPNVPAGTVYKESPIFSVLSNVESPDEHLRLLVRHGADLNFLSFGGTPAIHCAVNLGRYDLALKVLQSGADPRATTVNGKTRLGHLLFRAKVLSRNHTNAQQRQYDALLEWLDDNGEPLDIVRDEVSTGNY